MITKRTKQICVCCSQRLDKKCGKNMTLNTEIVGLREIK